nr:hypothetical protein [Tanacetum cinerariifolium]
METKDTLSSCSNSKAQQMQQIQDKAKKKLHESGFKRAFATLFGQDIETFTGTMFLNMEQLEKQLEEDFKEIGPMAAFNAILKFRDTLIQHLESVKKSIDERAQLKREYDSWVNERQMQTTEEKFDTSKALDASSVDKESGEVDQNAEECHDTRPFPAILTDNQIPEHSYQSLESENICLKNTVARFQKDFSRLEAHCVTLELKYQNHAFKEGQQSQFLKEKSNEAKVKHDIHVIQSINIELEHKVAKLLKENETLKKHYKELFDSIKITRAKTIEHTTSLISTNDKFKAQLQEKGFAIATLKNKLRKSAGNSLDTKFAKSSILGKPMLQSHRNQSDVRQPTAFMSERPRISEPRFASQVDMYNDLSKPGFKEFSTDEQEMTSDRNSSELGLHDHRNEQSSSKLVSDVVPPADKTATS